MNGLRKAALYLHGLDEADRSWLLDALTEEERQRLKKTLTELDEMDIPRSDAWLPELAETYSYAGEDVNDNNNDQASVIEAIERADLSTLTEIFSNEPDRIVAILLKYRVWSWRQTYISKQYLQKRERLLHALETPDQRLKPKLVNALLNSLVIRLNSLESKAAKRFEAVLSKEQQSEQVVAQPSHRRWLWRR
jgi:hypothetical protein